MYKILNVNVNKLGLKKLVLCLEQKTDYQKIKHIKKNLFGRKRN